MKYLYLFPITFIYHSDYNIIPVTQIQLYSEFLKTYGKITSLLQGRYLSLCTILRFLSEIADNDCSHWDWQIK